MPSSFSRSADHFIVPSLISAMSHHSYSLTDKKIYKNVVWLFVRLMLMSIINLVSVRFARGDSGLGLESYGIFNAVLELLI